MNQEELTKMVASILREMETGEKEMSRDSGEALPDISKIDLREQYLVNCAGNCEAFRKLKAKTPARLGSGRAGSRYKTLTMLRFRADHAAAQDSVFTEIGPEFAEKHGLIPVKTCCESRDQYLTRPDLGRRFDEENSAIIRSKLPQKPKVQLVIGDGLSSAAILANAIPCAKSMARELDKAGIDLGPILYVTNARVGAGDFVGSLTGCQTVCILVGERPGLVTAESMSAYLTYGPHTGIAESKRTVVSNIHRQGTPAEEAGVQIAKILLRMLETGKSGVELARL